MAGHDAGHPDVRRIAGEILNQGFAEPLHREIRVNDQ